MMGVYVDLLFPTLINEGLEMFVICDALLLLVLELVIVVAVVLALLVFRWCKRLG